jgi:endonuclease/exonuclease/phosphatase family metal-dependent hydrolase
VIVFIPLMGFRFSLGRSGTSSGPVLRVLSCNIQTGDFNEPALSEEIRALGVDIVALQECPPAFKLKLPAGWHSVQDGELAVFSRYPLHPGMPVRDFHPPHLWPRTCLLPCTVSTPHGDVAFNTVHLPSPRYGLQHILDRKTGLNPTRTNVLVEERLNRERVSQRVQRAVASQKLPVIIAGDFNMPVESTIYRRFWGVFSNAYSTVGQGYGWSEQVSVRGIPVGIRIDHILTGTDMKPLLCKIGSNVGSDHLPIIADLARVIP